MQSSLWYVEVYSLGTERNLRRYFIILFAEQNDLRVTRITVTSTRTMTITITIKITVMMIIITALIIYTLMPGDQIRKTFNDFLRNAIKSLSYLHLLNCLIVMLAARWQRWTRGARS